jgi:hypothetical protein
MSLTKVSFSMIDGATANVLDYGAYNDGTNAAATTAAIQAALNSGKRYVFLPEGKYLVNDTLYVPSYTTLAGVGANVNPYGSPPKITEGSVLVAATGAFTSAKAVVQIGQSSELTSVTLRDFVVDIQDASTTAIGVRKETCNHFAMFNIYVIGILTSVNTQIAYFNGNGTHAYIENLKLYGTKTTCYMDNTNGRECHDSVFNKVWFYPAPITGAVGMYYPVDGGDAISTWIMPYFETDNSGLVTGIYSEDLAAPEMTMIYPSWDGTFLWLWNAVYPPRSRFIGGNLSTFSPSQFNGPFGRCTIIGRQGNQLVEKLYLYDSGGEIQFSVDSAGFHFGRVSSGAALISRIQGGKKSEVIGTVNSGSIFTDTITVPNADIGDPVFVGMDWNGIGAYTLTAQVFASNTVRYWLQNNSGSPVNFGTRELKAVVFNGSIT